MLVQDAVREMPVTSFLAFRFLSGAALVAALFRRPLARLGRSGFGAGLRMGFWLTAGYVLQTYGLQRTSVSNTGFITGLFVVLTPLLGALLYGQRAGRLAWIAASVSTVGLFLLSGVGGWLYPEGDLLVLLCAGAFAMHILVTARSVRHHDAGALCAVQLGVCGGATLLAAIAAGDLRLPPSTLAWEAVAVTALLASALGFLVQSFAQRWTTPARTALLLASEPGFAGLFAYLIKGERLSALGWMGAGLIMGSIVAVEAAGSRPPRAPLAQEDPG